MEWLAVGESEWLGQRWVEAVEAGDEGWRCRFMPPEAVAPPCDAVLLLPGSDRVALSFPPPYVLACGGGQSPADGACTLRAAGELPHILRRWRQMGRIPLRAAILLPAYTCRAREALRGLGMPERLRAWAFLPDMLALCAVHPPVMESLTALLYPLIGRRHGMNAARVERSLRLAIESTWDRAPLPGLEACFGQSVDPERGKPTNREFLERMSALICKENPA